MTKRAWVELIISNISGGATPADLDSRYHPLVIGKLFGVAYANIISDIAKQASKAKDWSQFDAYLKSYKNVAVLHDEDRDEYYSLLPASIIELRENRGIRLISPMQDQRNKFDYIDSDSESMWGELEAGNIPEGTQYYREGGKIYYRNFFQAYITPGLLFKLLVPLSEFDDEEEIGVPSERSIEIFNIIRDMLQKRQPEESANDNTSKQV